MDKIVCKTIIVIDNNNHGVTTTHSHGQNWRRKSPPAALSGICRQCAIIFRLESPGAKLQNIMTDRTPRHAGEKGPSPENRGSAEEGVPDRASGVEADGGLSDG